MKEIDLNKAFAPIPKDCYEALMRAANSVQEEEKPVKKKLSFALVLTIVLILATVTALAITLSWDYFAKVAQIEGISGFYEDWSYADKIRLLSLMKEYGVAMDDARADELLKGNDEQALDAFMAEVYGGVNGRTDVITFAGILDKEWGDIDDWTMEQKAWYSQTLIDNGMMYGDDDIFRMPGKDAVAPEEAIAAAKKEIMRVWELTENDLAGYREKWTYETHSSDKEEKLLHYNIRLIPGEEGKITYYCSVANDGHILTKAEDPFAESPEGQKAAYAELANLVDSEARDMYQQFAKERGYLRPVGEADTPFEDWSLTDKAAFAALVRPVVIENMAANPDYADWAYVFYAKHVYGVPDGKAVPQETALTAARKALGEKLALSEQLQGYCDVVSVFYEVTNPEKPFWTFVFTANRHWDEVEALGEEPRTRYRVEIDAATGDTTRAFAFTSGDGVTGLEAVERLQ